MSFLLQGDWTEQDTGRKSASKSQNCTTDEAEGPLKIVYSSPLLKQGQLKQFGQGCLRSGFDCFQGWRCYKLSGQPVPVIHTIKKCFLTFWWNFMVFSSCLLPLVYSTLWIVRTMSMCAFTSKPHWAVTFSFPPPLAHRLRDCANHKSSNGSQSFLLLPPSVATGTSSECIVGNSLSPGFPH